MTYKLDSFCAYAKGKIAVSALNESSYISTENMLPNKGGIVKASSLPTVQYVQQYLKNDILVSNIRPYFKKIWLAEYDGGCSNDVLVLRAHNNCDPTFLYYVLANDAFFDYATATSKGTKMPRGDKASIMQYEVPLFDINTQFQIGKFLRNLDKKIELNQKINDNLQQQAQAIFRYWFVDFEPFGGSIPSDWKYINFSEFLTQSNEKSSDTTLPMFSVTDTGIFPRDKKFKKNLSMANTKSKVVRQTDLVFGMSREILNWGIMRHSIGGVSSAYNVYKVDSRINSFYLESYMKVNERYFKDLIKPASREGQGIDKNALMKKELLLPPPAVLEQYYNIESILAQAASHTLQENQRLAEIRDTLLPKLMSGEIDVSNLPL